MTPPVSDPFLEEAQRQAGGGDDPFLTEAKRLTQRDRLARSVFSSRDLLTAAEDVMPAPRPSGAPLSRGVAVRLGVEKPRLSDRVAMAGERRRSVPLAAAGDLLSAGGNFVRGVPAGVYGVGEELVRQGRDVAEAGRYVPLFGPAAGGVADLLPNEEERLAGREAVEGTLEPEGVAGAAGRLTGAVGATVGATAAGGRFLKALGAGPKLAAVGGSIPVATAFEQDEEGSTADLAAALAEAAGAEGTADVFHRIARHPVGRRVFGGALDAGLNLLGEVRPRPDLPTVRQEPVVEAPAGPRAPDVQERQTELAQALDDLLQSRRGEVPVEARPYEPLFPEKTTPEATVPPASGDLLDVPAQLEGMPRSVSSAAESDLAAPGTRSRSEPPGSQAEPVQRSVTAMPEESGTTRSTSPSERTGPITFRVGSIDPPSGRTVLQPTDDVKAIDQLAREAEPTLRQALDQISAEAPGTHVFGVRRKFERLDPSDPGFQRYLDKSKTKPTATLGDYLGGRLWVDNMADVPKLLKRMEAAGLHVPEGIAVDDFVAGGKDGYRAIHTQVQMPNGMTAEVQFVPREVGEVQEAGHEFYNELRGDHGPVSFERAQSLLTEMRTKLDDAWVRYERRIGGRTSPALGRARLAGAEGSPDTVTLPDGQKRKVTYRVVEADDLRPSHHPESFAPNPDYPEGVQGRRYHTDRAAQENVAGETQRLDGDRLIRDTGTASGSPIVTPDGVVVGGNQRTMMLQRARETAPEKLAAYRALLEERAQRFGLDPEQVRGMESPVLVRELDPTGTDVTDAAALRRFNDLTDTVSKKSRSGVDEGMARASRMANATTALDTFAETVGPEESLRGYLDGQHGRKFIDALISDGVLTRAEAGRFFDAKGQVTAEAKDLLERTFYAAAIGNADVLERVPKSILNKLDSSLPALVRSGRDETYSLRAPLAEALDELAQVAARKAEGSGISSLADLRAQGDIFADAAANPQARAIADLLESSPKGDVTKALRTYGRRVDEAVKAKGSNDLFDYTPPKQEDLFREVLQKGKREALVEAGTLFANPIMPVLKAIARHRELSGATFAGLGGLMQDSEDPTIEATGRFMMGLGALHAIGLPRIARAGGKAGRGLVDVLRKNPVGRAAVEFINPEALLAPQARQAILDYEDLVAKGRARAKEMGKKAADLGPEGDRAVSDVIEGEDWGAAPEDLEATMTVAQGIADEFDALGQMKVEAGVLPQVAVDAHKGKYAGPRLYAEYEALDALGEKVGTGAPKKTRIGAQKKRTLGSDEASLRIRDEKGEIREASYRAGRGIEKGYRDVAAAKLFQSLRALPGTVHPEFSDALDDFLAARNLWREAKATGAPASELAAAEELMRGAKQDVDALSRQFKTGSGDYVAMPDTDGMGVLRGMVVKKEVANSLNGLPDMRVTGPFMRFWKQKNTVYNPGTHIGNVASNVTMAHMAGMPMWWQPRRVVEAARDMGGYGKATRALAEAGVLDLNVVTAGSEGAAAGRRANREELLKLLETSRPKTAEKLRSLGLEKTTWDQVKAAAEKVHGPLARLYNNEDNIFRVAYYLHATTPASKGGLGLSAKEAVEHTRNDLINFRSRSPAIRVLRGTVSPFILYPAKALPTFAKHVIEHPWRYLGLMAAWGLLDQSSKAQVGAVDEADLPPGQRRGATGYGLPGITQLPFTGPRGEKAGYDVSRWTPLSALTTNAPPGASASLLSDRFPSILNPSGPITDLASIPLNVDPYTGDKRFSPAMTEGELARALAEAAGDQVLPPVLAAQRRRLVEDVRNNDPGATKVDAAGLLGLRPRYVRPGEYQQRAGYELEQALLKAKQDLRRGLRRSNNPARDEELYQQYDQRVQALQDKYDERVNP